MQEHPLQEPIGSAHRREVAAAAVSRWRKNALATSLGIAGLIHLLPLSGVLGAASLQQLYGIDIADPTLEILLRHRAVLFGLLGVLLIGAIPLRTLRPAALLAGTISTTSFLLIVFDTGAHADALQRVIVADVVALLALALASALHWRRPPTLRTDPTSV